MPNNLKLMSTFFKRMRRPFQTLAVSLRKKPRVDKWGSQPRIRQLSEQASARAARYNRSHAQSRQARRRSEFDAMFRDISNQFRVGATVFAIPRRARRKIARNRLRLIRAEQRSSNGG
jgi:hypothetical protein